MLRGLLVLVGRMEIRLCLGLGMCNRNRMLFILEYGLQGWGCSAAAMQTFPSGAFEIKDNKQRRAIVNTDVKHVKAKYLNHK